MAMMNEATPLGACMICGTTRIEPGCSSTDVQGGFATGLACELGSVGSNVRAYAHEQFAYWRCAACKSIHAAEAVDLEHYYRNYPFHKIVEDGRLRALYDNQLGRLRRAGVRVTHSVLDYGGGSGLFASHLRRRGFLESFVYDEYAPEHRQPALLARRYDCVLSQDVLEHVPDPWQFLRRLDELTEPGGLVFLGTPNAEAIDLGRAEAYRHTLHAPYHRHIFSLRALRAIGNVLGWHLERYYPTQYANTRLPFLNSRFYSFFLQRTDNTIDSLIEPPDLRVLAARLPQALYWGLFGSWYTEATDVMVVFRTGQGRENSRRAENPSALQLKLVNQLGTNSAHASPAVAAASVRMGA
jgi:SAM-dependent methyltransferase